ncbi:MAG TPA: GGDEF domain-containing protein [Sulfuricella sp.]|nr:GGDEF domain-containing protein [Sulfuricella sp.]
MQKLEMFFQMAAERILGTLPLEELRSLLLPADHAPLLARRRAEMIISRVRMVAALFALLTPLWIIVDMLVFVWPVSGMLAAGRLVASLAFGMLALSYGKSTKMADAYRALAILFGIPTLFFIYSHPLLSHFQMVGPAAAIAAGYAFLPFVMVAGLSVFPLTAVEGAFFALPVLLAEALVAFWQLDMLDWSSHLGAFWLLVLIAAVATLAGMSQLSFMISLVRQASHDGLTGCFARSSGEELLDIQFHIAARSGTPLSVVFADLDNFKGINDSFGHDAGDHVLKAAADALRSNLRTGDILLRWGGEEFAIIFPGTDCATAAKVIARLRERGMGYRPEGDRLTASFGIAERLTDQAKDWRQLVEIADQRMYQAKLAGKDRCVGCGEQ